MLWARVFYELVLILTRGKVDIFASTKCKLGWFVTYFCATYSSALLIILSIEKFIALYFPFRSRIICTLPIARKVVFITASMYAIFNAQYLFILVHRSGSCYFKAPVIFLDAKVIPILYSFGPFAIMLIFNFAIICKLTVAKWRNTPGVSGSINQAMSKSAVRGTAMLLTVSFAFIILTGPFAIALTTARKIASNIDIILRSLAMLNYAINSVLYCISGSRFRNELKKTICFCKQNSDHNSLSRNSPASLPHVNISTLT